MCGRSVRTSAAAWAAFGGGPTSISDWSGSARKRPADAAKEFRLALESDPGLLQAHVARARLRAGRPGGGGSRLSQGA